MLDETTHVIDERQLVLGLGFQLSESCLDDVAVVSHVLGVHSVALRLGGYYFSRTSRTRLNQNVIHISAKR
jgi:hypothetical protein